MPVARATGQVPAQKPQPCHKAGQKRSMKQRICGIVQPLSHHPDAVHGSLPPSHFSPRSARTSPPARMEKPLTLCKHTWACAAGMLLEPDESCSLQLPAVHVRRSPRKGISHIAGGLQPARYLSTREQKLLHWDAREMQRTLTSNSSDGQRQQE